MVAYIAIVLVIRAKRRRKRKAGVRVLTQREQKDWKHAVYNPKEFRKPRK